MAPLLLCRSQQMPTDRVTRIDPEPFRVLLLRRLRSPLPLCVRNCWCGRPHDVLGHHRAACSTTGALGRRGFAAESAVAQICREGGSEGVSQRDASRPGHRFRVDRCTPVRGGRGRADSVLEDASWRWTPPWCRHCTGDGTHRRRTHVEDGVTSARQESSKKERTLNFVKATEERDSWSSREKLGAGGQKRRRPSCGLPHAQRHRRAKADVWQCQSGVVQEMDLSSRLLVGESSGLFPHWKAGSPGRETRCHQSTTWWLTLGIMCSARWYSFGLV